MRGKHDTSYLYEYLRYNYINEAGTCSSLFDMLTIQQNKTQRRHINFVPVEIALITTNKCPMVGRPRQSDQKLEAYAS